MEIKKLTDGSVVVSAKWWAVIQDEMTWLACLDEAGVDDWDGIDYAHELYDEIQKVDEWS